MGKRFPIPREHLPKLRVSQQEHQAGKQLMAALLAHTVREFEAFAYDRSGVVDSKRWKSQYSRDDMSMYREREAGVTSYELAKTLRHCDLQSPPFSCTQDVADCAIVHTMEHPSDDAPYHYLGYKYFVKKSPTNAVVVKHRDSLYLEYCGMTRSRTGETLGFHLMQSVELSQFPDLTGHNSIRALQSSRYLYRQKSDRTVEVFMLGNMDLSGMIVKPIASIFSAGAQFRRRAVRRDAVAGLGRGEGCAVCKRGKPSKMVECHLCGEGICPRCRSTKRVWVSDSLGILGSFRKIQACSKCVMHANTGAFEALVERARSSQRSYQSSVSTDPSDSEVNSKSSEESAFDGVLYEDTQTTSRRQQSPARVKLPKLNRRRTQTPPTPQSPVVGRSFAHQGARIYSDAALCRSPEFEVPNRLESRPLQSAQQSRSYSATTELAVVDGSGYSRSVESIPAEPKASKMRKQTSDSDLSDQVAVMARLMELTSMAEATSYTTQVNGIYFAQQMQQQHKVQSTADWRK
ncbi:hypothetical protein PF005_g23690 [Phytophthora fragariae]|uniref:FYVE-type domain-containing protein n=1 Tax=Phytophthora fragariae TaxID=53985 RepID=A0A6A3IJZ5_9STRA|nr:hypothetical protein PF009_g24425 [Phytophthora fragariae]KAE8980424.1 hypothetical protein PF011_g22446 [Phytophthora fragariae]KAE9179431.1 hypothetical protein PF005_g23690 [Phytophthora fragariae]